MSSRFIDALLEANSPVVMEVKLRDGAGADLLGDRALTTVVSEYERVGAPCLSVVTGKWFGGTPALLKAVSSLTALPLLQKDFLTKESQLDQAVALGASAVLLTSSLLPATVLARMVDGALSRGLTPFVETTTHAQATAVPRAQECVVAVNNSDITNRERGPVDMSRSVNLLAAVRATGTRCPVSASGISEPAVAAELLDTGYAGLLIGTGLLRAEDIGEWMAALHALRR